MDGDKKSRRAARRSWQDWSALVSKADRSGLALAEFARRHGVSGRQLSWWKWRLSRRARADEARSTRTQDTRRAAKPMAAAPVTFVEARVVEAPGRKLARGRGTCNDYKRKRPPRTRAR